ncbi:unnamed protein product [Rotaria magnacalcarata]|uniref:Uncharacterized protein n=1 Tax=Rotaria magnacalcarata TaxID=392030 RepID=A0A820SLG0_9BILA|nr:unnamed protein product [Rotaria magnacalcarata]
MACTLEEIEKEIAHIIQLNTNVITKIRIKKDMLVLLKQEIEDLHLEQEDHNDQIIKLYDEKNKQLGPPGPTAQLDPSDQQQMKDKN